MKSPPELWAEISELETLARHLGEFGEIRITRSEPETAVAWEGERASGTVELEPSGWGTRVTLTAEVEQREPEAEPEPAVEPEPEPEPVAPPAPDPSPLTMIDHRFPGRAIAHTEPAAATRVEPLAEPPLPPIRPLRPSYPPRPGFWSRLFPPTTAAGELTNSPPTMPLSRPFGASAEVRPLPDPAPLAPDVPEPDVPSEPPPAPGDVPEVEPTPLPERELPDPDEPDEAATGPIEVAPVAEVPDADRTLEVLTGVLDTLGSAHHRPFSRG